MFTQWLGFVDFFTKKEVFCMVFRPSNGKPKKLFAIEKWSIKGIVETKNDIKLIRSISKC